MRALLLLIVLALDSSFAKDMDAGSPIVEVRAVFINCEPEEREDISIDNEALRFEREELFKHSVLQDCIKKMALTVKIATDSEPAAGDEYIPIEHVFQGQNKRVRLLNPYVLRLQRGTLLQAYKLKRIDTVAGAIENINANYVNEGKNAVKNARGRSRRSENHDRLTNDEDLNIQDCELMDNSTLNACLNSRNKRNEHNIVVEDTSKGEKYSQWKPYYDQELKKNRNGPNFYASSTTVTLIDSKFAKLNDDNMIDSDKKKSDELKQRSLPWSSYKSAENRKNKNSKDPSLESDYELDENARLGTESSTKDRKEKYEDKFDREFDVYEIGTPDLLYNVKVQLFEKLTNNEGNTLWNDLTKGEPASVSTLSPEWAGQDVIMRYHPMEWVPRKEFSLPSANLCLLSPVAVQKMSETDYTNDDEKYIVVPKEDILNVANGDVKEKARDENSSSFESTTENKQPKRHVMIRTTRALYFGEGDHYNLETVGNAPLLTLPHRWPHHVQIDLEARADENQLVPVGSSGRIMTVVSDSSRRTRTTLTVQVTNTGLAAAKFRTIARDCGPDFGSQINGGETVRESPFVIPPRHTKSIILNVPASVPSDVFHCLVSLLNDEGESVAVRDVTVKKGDRCFCVWHCECTCLSEDPKLLCREMSEAAQIAAGLSLRERVRHVRSICYQDVVCVDMLVTAIGTLIILLFLGVGKALLGLMFRSVGLFGLRKIVKLPRPLEHYYERCLRCRPVVYDDEGWPVDPKTKERTVRCISRGMEVFLNLTFFITTPCIIICDLVKQLCTGCRRSDVSSWSQSENAQKVYNSSHDIQVKKLLPKTSNCNAKRRRHHREMKKWMTPEAEDLSSNIWLEGLGKTAVMQPLLHDDFCHCDNSVVQQSCVDVADSEGDETEYVLMQIQKSKESLARSQRKLCSAEK